MASKPQPLNDVKNMIDNGNEIVKYGFVMNPHSWHDDEYIS